MLHTSVPSSLSQQYIDGTFASFAQLKEKLRIPSSQFFFCLQVRDFVHKNTCGFPNMPTRTPLEDIPNLNKASKGVISVR